MTTTTKNRITNDELPVPTESQEQIALFRWADYMSNIHPELMFMYHTPNGGKRNVVVAKKLKEEGVKAGVPDIFFPVPKYPYHGLYIEMKRQKGGTVSADQKRWIQFLKSQGYMVEVAKGCDKAIAIVEEYIKLPSWDGYEVLPKNSKEEVMK